MLRELSIRELTDIEMDMVSGGNWEGDTVTTYGTRYSSWYNYTPAAYVSSSSQYHESYQPTYSGSSYSNPTPAPEPETEGEPRCVGHRLGTNTVNNTERWLNEGLALPSVGWSGAFVGYVLGIPHLIASGVHGAIDMTGQHDGC